MTFQDIRAGCAPQDPRTKSRLLRSRWQGDRLHAHGRVPGTTSREAGFGESSGDSSKPMTSSKGTGQRRGYSEAHSRPLPRAGMATTCRTWEDLRVAWHYCPAGPDISTTVPSPAPTMACLYGLEAAGPTSQRDIGRRQENRQSDPSGDGPGESAEPSPRAHAPLIKMRWGVATVIARQAAGLLP